jgi:peptide methionine sulfoxide reductase msrA/msrB
MGLVKIGVFLLFVFLPDQRQQQKIYDTAIFGAGCFWNLEYHFNKIAGVKETACVYSLGKVEAVLVTYDPSDTSFKSLCKVYFSSHDPTLNFREKYKAIIQCSKKTDFKTAETLLREISEKGLQHSVSLSYIKDFSLAEEMHQNWFTKKGTAPKCSAPSKFIWY